MPDEELDQELQDALKDIVKSCENEDKEIRSAMVRSWKKNEEFWHGVQYLFWSDRDDTWRSPLDMNFDDDEATEELGSFSDKVIDIFRGHGEAIIAALSAQIPALRYLPDDADSDDDVLAARTRSKLADLIQRHNKSKMVALRSLFFLALGGLVASYRYTESDPKYGTIDAPQFENDKADIPTFTCEDCDFSSEEEIQECPQCGSSDIKQEIKKKTIPKLVGTAPLPKSRVKIDIFGPLHFKVPYYARNQAECTYFILFGDLGKDSVKFAYPKLEEDIDAETIENTDRFARSDFMAPTDVEQNNLVTVKKVWLRPAAYYRCNKKELRDKIGDKFPNGTRVTLIGKNNKFAEAVPEEFDKRIEIGQAGLSTFIHSDPILRPLVMIQEMRNDLVNLILETIKHGIPSILADPSVLNFDEYGKFEAVPGYIYPTKAARPGEAISNSFHETPRSIVSREVAVFLQQLDKDAQFCVGSFPSIYGGPSEGKSRTFAEYAASRQMALQRLSIVWTFFLDWWVRTISGSVDLYIDSMISDEYFTKFENESYVKVWIRRTELAGKVGGVEPESSETFPTSLAQKKDMIMKLMELNNEYINEALYQPDNARVIQDVLAMNEFKLPGEAQRVKQCLEINALIKSGPSDATTTGSDAITGEGQAPQKSSVPVDPDVDDHKVHIATITSWAVDVLGLDCKQQNPNGYANVMAHRREHLAELIKATLTQNTTPAGQEPASAQPQGAAE